jgi:hypothetical protein
VIGTGLAFTFEQYLGMSRSQKDHLIEEANRRR